jgi:hypothetical protein
MICGGRCLSGDQALSICGWESSNARRSKWTGSGKKGDPRQPNFAVNWKTGQNGTAAGKEEARTAVSRGGHSCGNSCGGEFR